MRARGDVQVFAVAGPDSKCDTLTGFSGVLMSQMSTPAGVMPRSPRIWCATNSVSPNTSSELERILLCGSSVWTIILRFFGSVTSIAVKFFGAASCPSHITRRPSLVFCMPMPSPTPPKPPISWWAISFMFSASVWDACLPGLMVSLIAFPFLVSGLSLIGQPGPDATGGPTTTDHIVVTEEGSIAQHGRYHFGQAGAWLLVL